MDGDEQPPTTSASPEESPYNPASAPHSEKEDAATPQIKTEADVPAAQDSEAQGKDTEKAAGQPESHSPAPEVLQTVHDGSASSDAHPPNGVPPGQTGPEAHVLSEASPQAASEPTDHMSPAIPPTASAASAPSPSREETPAEQTSRKRSAADANPQESAAPAPAKKRLPTDHIGILEDRIAEDPRGDPDAFLELVEEFKRRNKIDEARKVYERTLEVFPTAAEVWISYITMELDNDQFAQAEQLFARVLGSKLPSVHLWVTYLNYVRRRFSLNNDPDGRHRKTISEAFDAVLKEAGKDKDSGDLWVDYIHHLKSLPGNATGTAWQDQQKKDSLRAGYRKAICVPHGQVGAIWGEYTKFEAGVDRAKSGPLLQQYSPSLVHARQARMKTEQATEGLNPSTLARLPPALGFEGDEEYMKQVAIWNGWIQVELEDPLALKDNGELGEWKSRVLYVYKQALMPLRFWPEMWYAAVQFCTANGLDDEAKALSQESVKANPESCLLAFQRAERVELDTVAESKDTEGLVRRGDAVRKPYEDVIQALDRLTDQAEKRQQRDIASLEEAHKERERRSNSGTPGRGKTDDDDGDHDERGTQARAAKAQLDAQIQSIKRGVAVQCDVLRKTKTHAWIALMYAMRRVQGQGNAGADATIRGFRGVFRDVTKHRAKLTSDVYVAGAQVEHKCYPKDNYASRIYERGYKLFSEDDDFAMAYLQYLVSLNDTTNARAVFKKTVDRLEAKPETVGRAKSFYAFWHHHESCFGELNIIKELEKRMGELFPEDARLSHFASRFSSPTFDPCAIRPVVSPAAQMRPKSFMALNQPTMPTTMDHSPRPSTSVLGAAFAGNTNSPKRSLEDSDNESQPPRKFMRGDSPLKGAAGRRLDAAKRTQMRNELSAGPDASPVIQTTSGPSSHPLHPNIFNFLKLLPSAQAARTQLPMVPPAPAVLEALQRANLEQVLTNHDRLVSSVAAGYNPLAQAQTQAVPGSMMGMPAQMASWQQPQQVAGMPPQQAAYGQQGQYGYGQPSYYRQ